MKVFSMSFSCAFLRIILMLCAINFASVICVAQTKRDTTTTPLAVTECSDVGSMLLRNGYVLSVAKCEGRYQAWSSRDTTITSDSNADSAIDRMSIGNIRPNETVSINPYCTAKGKPIEWLAVYDWNGSKTLKGYTGRISRAWGISSANGRFFRYTRKFISSVTCIADSADATVLQSYSNV